MSEKFSKYLNETNTVGIVGACFSGGQPKSGVEQGPTYMIEFGLVDQIKGLGWNVEVEDKFTTYDHFKIPDDTHGNCKNVSYVSNVCKSIKESVAAHAKKGNLALTLGGDHSIAMGTISGTAAVYGDELRVIWVDAHADINTPAGSPSGNLHGMPVSFLMGLESCSDLPQFSWLKPCLKPENIVYIGLRDVDPPERQLLKKHGVKAFSMYEVDKFGIGKVMEMALEYLGFVKNTVVEKNGHLAWTWKETKPLHLSFDVDGLDPTVAPSTGTPVRGGLTFREGHFICESCAETGSLVGIDLVEVNPTLSIINGEGNEAVLQTVQVGCGLVRSALGETLLGC